MKEVERSELLDQFRTLSNEAAHLETSNHNLVTEANQSKVQLSVALEHATDLEKKVESHQAIVQAYEKQVEVSTTLLSNYTNSTLLDFTAYLAGCIFGI